MDQEHTISVSRRTVRLALAFAVVLAVLAPVAVVAAGGTFVDDDTSIFEEDIEWLVANGITSGCGADTYCPEGNVTRGQMAAFMRRLATKKVVDAATADSAADSDTLGGQPASAFAAAAHTHSSAQITNAPGVAAGFDDSGGLSTTLAVVASVTLTVPSDGYILASGDLQMNISHTAGSASIATVGLSLSSTTLDQQSQDNAVGVPSGSATGNHFFSPGLTAVFPVSAGENTVYILGSVNSSTSGSYNDATVTALFVPTAYGSVANEGAPSLEDAAD